MKYSEMKWGIMEALINKLGGIEGVEKFLRGEITVSQPTCFWREQDGVICFTLPPTDGTTGPQWIERLEARGFRLSKWAKDVLNSKDFKPTSGVIYNIAVLKGTLWSDNKRITKNIRAEANNRKLTKANAEVACMIREKFTKEDIEAMGLSWIITMHEPIKDSDGDPSLLRVSRGDDDPWLSTSYDNPAYRWNRGYGFAFVVSQVDTQDFETQN